MPPPDTPRGAAPPATAPDGPLVLVYRGGADLSFRDASGTKRRVRRGEPFTTDEATTRILLATDPTVLPVELETALLEEAAEAAPAPEPEAVPVVAPVAIPEPVSPPAQPEAPAGDKPSGAITLGDLPRSAIRDRG